MLLYEMPIDGTIIPKTPLHYARCHHGLCMHGHFAYHYILVTNKKTLGFVLVSNELKSLNGLISHTNNSMKT